MPDQGQDWARLDDIERAARPSRKEGGQQVALSLPEPDPEPVPVVALPGGSVRAVTDVTRSGTARTTYVGPEPGRPPPPGGYDFGPPPPSGSVAPRHMRRGGDLLA